MYVYCRIIELQLQIDARGSALSGEAQDSRCVEPAGTPECRSRSYLEA